MKDLMVVGYFEKWLVVMDENGGLFVRVDEDQVLDPGTVVDDDMMFVPLNFMDTGEQMKIRKILCEED